MFDCFKKKRPHTRTSPGAMHPIKDEPTKKPRGYPKSYLDTALSITGEFEGSGFKNVSDNFDKQGVSAGILQWCYGQGSLQRKILAPLIETMGADEIDKHFPRSVSITAYMSNKKAVRYAKRHMLRGKKLKAEWRQAWRVFLGMPEVIAQQKKAADSIASKAWYYCEKADMYSARSFCFFFDVVTQNGSMKGVSKPENVYRYNEHINNDAGINKITWLKSQPGHEAQILFSWICLRVTRNKWASDVIARKGSIAHMRGTVHGNAHDFRSEIS